MTHRICLLIGLIGTLVSTPASAQRKPQVIYRNDRFVLYPDSVVQENKYRAQVISATEMQSDYQSPANAFASARIEFKLSINGKDNEMAPGMNHVIDCLNDNNTTPLLEFGKPLKQVTKQTPGFLKPNTRLTIRVDMRKALQAMDRDGFLTYNGQRIYRADFKGLYVAGATAPLSWDFDNLVNKPQLHLTDPDGDGIYTVNLILNKPSDAKATAGVWNLSRNLDGLPKIQSDIPLTDAVYQLSLEEMLRAIEPDSTFRTGQEWAGVWTRDISYSIILAMAYMQPRVAYYSLMRKVNKHKRIIQDTGTGGAYPVSTDRMIWATAAWQLFKATGDTAWLRESYTIISNSLEDDVKNAYDPATGLVRGESSFLDWREQTYPRWMQPADIYMSFNLGTNAAHFQANKVASEMARLLGDQPAFERYNNRALTIRKGINQYLWMQEKGYYGQFLYGRTSMRLSPKSEALGEALCILFNIADPERAKEIVRRVPVMSFGVPTVYPQIPGIPPYHNNSMWPFVQAYWMLAAKQVGNESSVMHSIASIYRAAALFLTNKENLELTNGDFAGTEINSSVMLWSLSGNIALVHQVLFGIQLEEDRLRFSPMVPYELRGRRTLTGFRYRQAELDIEVVGHGNRIAKFLLDGREAEPMILASTTGKHQIRIELDNQRSTERQINMVPELFTPNTPAVELINRTLTWKADATADRYQVWSGDQLLSTQTSTRYVLRSAATRSYQVIALAKDGTPSFASEPVEYRAPGSVIVVDAEGRYPAADRPYKGAMGKGFIEMSHVKNTVVEFRVPIKQAGVYAIRFRYANGHGPTNTSNKCAIRSLLVNFKQVGTMVFPQRGNEEWSNWGWSNVERVYLPAGVQRITLDYQDFNRNMNGEVNEFMLDRIEVVRAGR